VSSTSRRLAVLDIETVSLNPSHSKGALDGIDGRVVCVGLLIDDSVSLKPLAFCENDERALLEKFWASLGETDLFIGHGIRGFDLPMLRQRSWLTNVRPSRTVDLRKYTTVAVYDTLEVWTNWSYQTKGASLDRIAAAFGCGTDSHNGGAWSGNHAEDVARWWAAGDRQSIVRSCMADVWRAYRVFCRMEYRQPLGMPLPAEMYRAPHDAREPVMVSVQAKPENAPERPQSRPFPVEERSRRRSDENREIFYRAEGNELVLSGFTITIKDTLKKIYGAHGRKISEKPARYEWLIAADKFDSVAGLCAKSGIRLVAVAA
jgi:hypothetical protein